MWFLKRLFLSLIGVIVALWLVNTNAFETIPADQQSKLIAHRGVHQIYAGTDRAGDTCTANPIFPSDHDHIANTIPSIEAAFAAGADVVEIDVHLTSDNQFAVFHDWTLECQTDGSGVTHEQDMATLKMLDLGYGYTTDGATYPLRGTAVGAMPTLADVLSADLAGEILINFKSNRAEEGVALGTSPFANDPTIWGVYGGAAPVQTAMESTWLRGFDKPALTDCLISYAKTGWAGRVPVVCHEMIIAVPMDYAPYLWGWPHKFTRRMKAVGTDVILWGPYDGTGFSSGIDDAATLARVPEHFDGYIWTNRIEIIGPMLDRDG